jgi:hypothetical protein
MDSAAPAPRYKIFTKMVQNCLDDHAFITSHVGLVRERAERIAVMVSSSKPFYMIDSPEPNLWLTSYGIPSRFETMKS